MNERERAGSKLGASESTRGGKQTPVWGRVFTILDDFNVLICLSNMTIWGQPIFEILACPYSLPPKVGAVKVSRRTWPNV